MAEPASDDGGGDGGSGGRLEAALAAIDAANADDPAIVVVGGVERPKELTHAEMMTRWVRHLPPGGRDEHLTAARAPGAGARGIRAATSAGAPRSSAGTPRTSGGSCGTRATATSRSSRSRRS